MHRKTSVFANAAPLISAMTVSAIFADAHALAMAGLIILYLALADDELDQAAGGRFL